MEKESREIVDPEVKRLADIVYAKKIELRESHMDMAPRIFGMRGSPERAQRMDKWKAEHPIANYYGRTVSELEESIRVCDEIAEIDRQIADMSQIESEAALSKMVV